MKPQLKKIWLVWGRVKGLPNVTWESRKEAALEAWRLALKNPGRSFLVMAAVDVRRIDEVPIPEATPIVLPMKENKKLDKITRK